MKISESWLREWANPPVDTNTLVAQITMAGLEVDAIEPVAGDFSGVIVGRIIAVAPHPDAEKLRICQVEGHLEGVQQVVCGAPNAREGLVIPFATIGAQLPDLEGGGNSWKIKKAKLRGVESFGMLCGQTELQCGDDDSGLWELPADAPVGDDLRDYLQLNDKILELDLTPNRSDCLSIRGIAREVAVLNNCDYSPVAIEPVVVTAEASRKVSLLAGSACSRYVGRVIQAVNNNQPSPAWLVEKLRRSGLSSLGPIVDVTNYVLIELGQPMHAFDAAKVNGDIHIRFANSNESLKLLNNQTVELSEHIMVIADDSQALAFAGVMGGESSAVSDETTDIILESAFFEPIAIAGKARAFGLHTDSSHHFERGVDPELQTLAIERASTLILEICGGRAGPLFGATLNAELPKSAIIDLNKARLTSKLGLKLDDQEVERMLTGLGLMLADSSDEGWQFVAPSYRFDLAIEADLVEELARLYGYDKLPTRTPKFSDALPAIPEAALSLREIASCLVARDYREAVTYSFVDPKVHAHFVRDQSVAVLRNPISADMAEMRTSLLPGLISALRYNLNRQQSRVRLFESGLVFEKDGDGYPQERRVAGLITGPKLPHGWSQDIKPVDFYDIKADVESLLLLTRRPGDFSFQAPEQCPGFMHPGQTAEIVLAGEVMGFVGCIHPSTLKALDCSKGVFVFEIKLEALLKSALPRFSSLSRFPAVSRDLAVVVSKESRSADIEQAIRESAGDSLKSVGLFDVYAGEAVAKGQKSLAYELVFQHNARTLKDAEIQQAVDNVVKSLVERYGVSLR